MNTNIQTFHDHLRQLQQNAEADNNTNPCDLNAGRLDGLNMALQELYACIPSLRGPKAYPAGCHISGMKAGDIIIRILHNAGYHDPQHYAEVMKRIRSAPNTITNGFTGHGLRYLYTIDDIRQVTQDYIAAVSKTTLKSR